MTVSFKRTTNIVKVFRGVITHGKECINVIFNCYTDEIKPNESYQCVALSHIEDGVRYTVAGSNIKEIELIKTT
jgi:hypothetical protein